MKYKLREVAQICYGKNQKEVQCAHSEIPILGTGGLMGYSSKPLYSKPSVLIGRKGSISKVRYIEQPFWTVDTLFYTKINEDIVYPRYLYYLLSLIDFSLYDEGTSIPSLRTETLNNVEIEVPSLDVQKKSLVILEAIDKKIENNTKLNDNLEEQIELYYQYLFVTNAKSKWKKGTISDLGDVIGGGTPSKARPEYYTKNGIGWITPKDLATTKAKFISHGENDISELGLKNSSATIMPKGTILFSSRAPIGYIAIASGEVTTNQGFKSVVPHPEIGTAYVYSFIKHNIPVIEGLGSGTTFKEVSGGTMRNVPAIIPDEGTLRKFTDFCTPLLNQQYVISEENRKLTSLRDYLLPMLMSGQISIGD